MHAYNENFNIVFLYLFSPHHDSKKNLKFDVLVNYDMGSIPVLLEGNGQTAEHTSVLCTLVYICVSVWLSWLADFLEHSFATYITVALTLHAFVCPLKVQSYTRLRR